MKTFIQQIICIAPPLGANTQLDIIQKTGKLRMVIVDDGPYFGTPAGTRIILKISSNVIFDITSQGYLGVFGRESNNNYILNDINLNVHYSDTIELLVNNILPLTRGKSVTLVIDYE